ncbi:MAG TPA: hypothetical protein VK030_02420 [Actinomycetales bacterium]|nr:hypothetical protein [Actinomycetales bacterium]
MKWRALLITILLSLSIGAAASLTLHSDSAPYTFADARCVASAHLIVSQQTFTFDLPAKCVGKPAEIRVKSGTSQRIETIAAASESNTFEFSPQLASIDKIFLAVDTWPVAVDWEYDADISKWIECIGDCYITDIEIIHVPNDHPPYYQLKATIKTDVPSGVVWQLRLNASDSHLPFLAKRLQDARGQVKPQPVNCSADPRIVLIEGRDDWNQTHIVTPGSPIEIQFFGYPDTGNGNIYSCP